MEMSSLALTVQSFARCPALPFWGIPYKNLAKVLIIDLEFLELKETLEIICLLQTIFCKKREIGDHVG